MRIPSQTDSDSHFCGLSNSSNRINPLSLGNGAISSLSHQPLPNSIPREDASISMSNEILNQTNERNVREVKRGWSLKSFQLKSTNKEKPILSNAVTSEVRIELGEESADLLGDFVMAGMLETVPEKKRNCRIFKNSKTGIPFRASLTNKFFSFKKKRISLDDLVAVTWLSGSRQFTLHSFPKPVPRCFGTVPILQRSERKRTDLTFKTQSVLEIKQWLSAFAELHCFIHLLSETISPLKREKTVASLPSSALSSSALSSSVLSSSTLSSTGLDVGSMHKEDKKMTWNDSESSVLKFPPNPVAVVVINPNSGRRKAEKIFKNKVKPILELAGFKLSVFETNRAKHAEEIAQSLDLSKCINGIICVGGDGIVNEVLNGLYRRSDVADVAKIPVGVVPAGSDNSLVWSVVGIRDATSAALAIVKGEHFPVDSLHLWREGIATPGSDAYVGHTIAYFGFMSDVLELSSQYQRRFGPLRYLIAGLQRMIHLPSFHLDVDILPAIEGKLLPSTPPADMSLPHASTSDPASDAFCSELISSISLTADRSCLPVFSKPDSEVQPKPNPSQRGLMSDLDLAVPYGRSSSMAGSIFMRSRDLISNDNLSKGKRSPPSDFKRSPGGITDDDIVISMSGLVLPSPHTSPARHRVRTKLRDYRVRAGWVQLDPDDSDVDSDMPRISSTKSEADVGDKDVSFPSDFMFRKNSFDNLRNVEAGEDMAVEKATVNTEEEKEKEKEKEIGRGMEEGEGWVTKKGPFLGVMVCNHACKSVQCFDSQALAPEANAEDGFVDVLLVRPVGRIQLIRFLLLMQFGMHVDLPFVEYVKARAVKLNMGLNEHNACGVDGELLPLEKSAFVSVKHSQYQIIGRSKTSST